MYKLLDITPSKPLNYEQGISFFIDGLNYKIKQPRNKVFYFSILTGSGGLFNGLSFVKDSAEGPPNIKKYTIKLLLKSIFFKKNTIKFSGNYIIFFDKWTSNHYHYHCDFLPRLFLLTEKEIEKSTLVLPDTPYIKNVGLKLLNLIGFNFKKILLLKDIENLIIFGNTNYLFKTHTSGYSNPTLNQLLKIKISENIFNSKIAGPSRIYVKRGIKYGRIVLNEAEIIELLTKKYGFVTIDFDKMDITESIRIMNTCKVMIGMHGAALTNSFYMPKDSFLFEFRWNGRHHNHCYWHLANSIEINYYAIFGLSDDETKLLEGRGCNLTIPISSIEEALKVIPCDI